MTPFSAPKRKAALAADAFEKKIERAFFQSETLIILDPDTVQRSCELHRDQRQLNLRPAALSAAGRSRRRRMARSKDEFLKAMQPTRKLAPMDVLKPPPQRIPQSEFERLQFNPTGTELRKGRSSVRSDLERVPRANMEREKPSEKKIEFKRPSRSTGREFDR